MDKQLSDKIKIASFLCTVMVVYRHSLNHEAFFGEWRGETYSGLIEATVSTLTEIAVPFFFLISGFFFFRNSYYKKEAYTSMVKKKGKTLLVPFIIWNLAGIIPLLVTKQFNFKDSIWEYGTELLLSNWYGALWYVRDLLTLMLLVPLYGWIFSVNKNWIYFIVGGITCYFWLPVDCGWISTEGVFFFLLGGILQKYNYYIDKQFPLWFTLCLATIWLFVSIERPYWLYLHKVNTILGVITFWQLLNTCPQTVNEKLLGLAKYSFFIYVTHLYVIKFLKVTLAYYFWGNEIVALIAYIILPIITILLTVIVGKLWSHHSSKSFYIVTGDRG